MKAKTIMIVLLIAGAGWLGLQSFATKSEASQNLSTEFLQNDLQKFSGALEMNGKCGDGKVEEQKQKAEKKVHKETKETGDSAEVKAKKELDKEEKEAELKKEPLPAAKKKEKKCGTGKE